MGRHGDRRSKLSGLLSVIRAFMLKTTPDQRPASTANSYIATQHSLAKKYNTASETKKICNFAVAKDRGSKPKFLLKLLN
jgi:hypothetical protein